MYARGYTDGLALVGMQSMKTARPAPLKGLKGLLGGAKTKAQTAMKHFRRKPAALPAPITGQIPSTTQANQNLDLLRSSQQHPSTFQWGGQKPAPPAASRIDQFEANLRGAAPPRTPTPAAAPAFKRPEVAGLGQVPKAPPDISRAAGTVTPIRQPNATPKTAPGKQPDVAAAAAAVQPDAVVDKKPGLLARGAKWMLPAAAVGGGAYALTRPDNPEMTPLPQQEYGAQYAPYYGSELPTY